MLNVEELREIAGLKGLTLQNAEKDYIQELVLFSIYSASGGELVFKGGTCLYKIYKLNRFSEDLDFTLNGKADLEKLAGRVIMNLSLLGISGKIKEMRRYGKETNVRMLFTGPLYKGYPENLCFLPLNISTRERAALPPKPFVLTPIYREIPSFEVFPMDKNEILAEKVRTIFTRVKPRDVYDLWFLIKKLGTEPDPGLINRKLRIYKLKFDKRAFSRKIEGLKKMWSIDLKGLLMGQLPDFEEIKTDILKAL